MDDPIRDLGALSAEQQEMVEIARALKNCVAKTAIDAVGGTVDNSDGGVSSQTLGVSAMMRFSSWNCTEESRSYIAEQYNYGPAESSRSGWFETKLISDGQLKFHSFEKYVLQDPAGNILGELGGMAAIPENPDTSALTNRYQWHFDREYIELPYYFREIGHTETYSSVKSSYSQYVPCTVNNVPILFYSSGHAITSNGQTVYSQIISNYIVTFNNYISTGQGSFTLDRYFENGYAYSAKRGRFNESVSADFIVKNSYRGSFKYSISGSMAYITKSNVVLTSNGEYTLTSTGERPSYYRDGTEFSTDIWRVTDDVKVGSIVFNTNIWKIYIYDNGGRLLETLNWVTLE